MAKQNNSKKTSKRNSYTRTPSEVATMKKQMMMAETKGKEHVNRDAWPFTALETGPYAQRSARAKAAKCDADRLWRNSKTGKGRAYAERSAQGLTLALIAENQKKAAKARGKKTAKVAAKKAAKSVAKKAAKSA